MKAGLVNLQATTNKFSGFSHVQKNYVDDEFEYVIVVWHAN